jgi:hypothetical protein
MRFLGFILTVSLIASCTKDQSLSNGIIVGWNYGSCPQCGGFYLNLSNDTAINPNTYYVLNYSDNLNGIINQYSSDYNKDHNPIYVSVSWQPVPNKTNWIRVTNIFSR